MNEYITRNNAISVVCFGCNQQFSDKPCEPNDCVIRKSIMALTTADVAPIAEVAREIVEDVKVTLLDYHLQESKKYSKSISKTKKQFDIETQSYRAVTDAIIFALKTLGEIEKKYTEEGK